MAACVISNLAHGIYQCESVVLCLLQGIPPAALAKVQSEPLREFITTCINMDPKKRPGALQLLRHEFFDSLKPGNFMIDSLEPALSSKASAATRVGEFLGQQPSLAPADSMWCLSALPAVQRPSVCSVVENAHA